MTAGKAHIADPLDTVHHEMDSMVHGHHVYKLVWLPVIGDPEEGACQSTL